MNSKLKKLYFYIFPRKCISCGEVVPMEQYYCDECRDKMPYIKGKRCAFCGEGKDSCSCKKHKHRYERIVAPFYYDSGAKNALLKLKRYPVYAKGIGEECFKVIEECYSDINFDIVTAVPLSKSRKRAGGFNHSEKLAREIASHLGVEYEDLLCVLYNPKSQHELKNDYRAGNVRGIYDKIKGKSVDGKTVLLVDDVKTSGATLDECALMLKLYGAEAVYSLAGAIAKGKEL